MANPIVRKDWESADVRCLSKGRAGNARVYLLETPEKKVVIKDFRKSPWWIRLTWGRWMVGHEYRLMKCLEGLPGVPQNVFRVDAYAFGMDFLEGMTFGDYNQRNAKVRRGLLPPEAKPPLLPLSYFRDLERLVCAMHRRNVTHLDTRNAKNVIILPDNKPALIDFQSGVYLRKWYPKWFRKLLLLADLSSVYKHYYHFCVMPDGSLREGPGAFPASRAKLFLAHLRLRRLWVLKGYKFISQRKPKHYERCLMERFGQNEKGRS
jgi:predicted Ser/Thr protein kinase